MRKHSSEGREALVIELVGTRSNRDAIGAVVRVETEDGVSTQSLSEGSGYVSQHTKKLHFGLGDRTRARNVTVVWPSGKKQEFDEFEAGFRYSIRECDVEPEGTRIEPLGRARRSSEPIAAFRYGIEQVPDFESFYTNLARVHADRGDYASSSDVLRRLLQRKPDHEAAKRALVQLPGR